MCISSFELELFRTDPVHKSGLSDSFQACLPRPQETFLAIPEIAHSLSGYFKYKKISDALHLSSVQPLSTSWDSKE